MTTFLSDCFVYETVIRGAPCSGRRGGVRIAKVRTA